MGDKNLMGDLLDSVEAYGSGGLKVNSRFASNYNSSERAKELVRSKDLLKDDERNSSRDDSDDSESETEDEDAEMLSTELDLKIIQTINSLRKKDPSIYDSNTRWFETETEASPVLPNDAKKKKRFKDIAREQLLSTGEEVESSQYAPSNAPGRSGAIAYDEEQRQLRRAFLQSANDSLIDDEAEMSGILEVKATTTPTTPKILELKAALHEMKQLGLQRPTGRDENDSRKTVILELQDEAEREEFLENYFSKALWKADRRFEPGRSVDVGRDQLVDVGRDQLVASSVGIIDSDCDTEDGEEVERMEKFESKYNFRFEELQEQQKKGLGGSYEGTDIEGDGGSYHVVGHVRNTQGSLRRVDDKRKVERERRRERKETERRQQEAELRRLKNLKRQEVQSPLTLTILILADHAMSDHFRSLISSR